MGTAAHTHYCYVAIRFNPVIFNFVPLAIERRNHPHGLASLLRWS